MKEIILSIILLLCINILKAQNESNEYFLWEVKINDTEFTLAGSVHTGKPELLPLPDAYIDAYQKADKVVFELESNGEELVNKIFSYAKKDSLDESQFLNLFLSDDSKEILKVLFEGKETMLNRYYQYEGWMLNMAVAGRRSILLGYDPELSVDKFFYDLAVNDGKPIIGLDKIETQLQLLDFDVPLETQIKILESGIQRAEHQALADKALYDCFYKNKQKKFEEAFLASMDMSNPQIKAMYTRIFINRNKAWVDKMIRLSEKQTGKYFMLVGSGHYFGPGNVRELLEEKGYEVSPLF